MELLVLILAGGQSRRMGRDKAALPFEGGTMLTHLVSKFQKSYPVMVSVGERGRYDTCGAPEIVDHYPGQGPLAGLEAAFSDTNAETVFLTGTDLPGITPVLLEAMWERFSPEAQAMVIRRKDGKMEPLCGLYRSSCLEHVRQCLAEGRRSFKGLFQRIAVQYMEEAELPGFDLERMLDNLNTPEDYRRFTRGE